MATPEEKSKGVVHGVKSHSPCAIVGCLEWTNVTNVTQTQKIIIIIIMRHGYYFLILWKPVYGRIDLEVCKDLFLKLNLILGDILYYCVTQFVLLCMPRHIKYKIK